MFESQKHCRILFRIAKIIPRLVNEAKEIILCSVVVMTVCT